MSDNALGTILSLIKEHHLTEKELLKQCDINTSFTDWKNGRIKKPSYDKLLKIAQYFNVSLDYLTGRTDYINNLSNDNYPLSMHKKSLKYVPSDKPSLIIKNIEQNISEEEFELLKDFRLLNKHEQNIIMGKISEMIYNKNIEKNNSEMSDEFIEIDFKNRMNR